MNLFNAFSKVPKTDKARENKDEIFAPKRCLGKKYYKNMVYLTTSA